MSFLRQEIKTLIEQKETSEQLFKSTIDAISHSPRELYLKNIANKSVKKKVIDKSESEELNIQLKKCITVGNKDDFNVFSSYLHL